MSHPKQQICVKIEGIKKEDDKSKQSLLDPNTNVKQEPIGEIQEEIIKKELLEENVSSLVDTKTNVKPEPIDDIIQEEIIKKELLEENVLSLVDTKTNVKPEPIGDIQEEIKKELYADHKIKEEMVIGPTVLQHYSVVQESYVQSTHIDLKNYAHTRNKFYDSNVVSIKTKQHQEIRKITHPGKSQYKCDICHRYFKRKANLKGHVITHTGNSPYKCAICNKCLTTKQTLKMHVMIHTGDLPYKCEICNKSFTRKSYLKEHAITHTRKSPSSPSSCTIF